MKINLKQALIYLTIAFVIVSIYNNPEDSADSVGALLGDLGNFFGAFVDKGAEFIGGLSED